MTGPSMALMAASLLLVWGGLGVSVALLARRPEREDLPEGGDDDPGA